MPPPRSCKTAIRRSSSTGGPFGSSPSSNVSRITFGWVSNQQGLGPLLNRKRHTKAIVTQATDGGYQHSPPQALTYPAHAGNRVHQPPPHGANARRFNDAQNDIQAAIVREDQDRSVRCGRVLVVDGGHGRERLWPDRAGRAGDLRLSRDVRAVQRPDPARDAPQSHLPHAELCPPGPSAG